MIQQSNGTHAGPASEVTKPNSFFKELLAGILVEREHTENVFIALQIAKDHLAERHDYYTALANSGIMDEKEALAVIKQNDNETLLEKTDFDVGITTQDMGKNRWTIDAYDVDNDKGNLKTTPEFVAEAIYDGNAGIMEIAEFFQVANDAIIKEFDEYMKRGQTVLGWLLIQDTLGKKLIGDVFGTDADLKAFREGRGARLGRTGGIR